jgi:hypothetical protein
MPGWRAPPFHCQQFPILGPDGRPILIGGIAIDITGASRQKALRESEERFRRLFLLCRPYVHL